MNREKLKKKIPTVMDQLLHEKGYIAFVELFMAMDYLQKNQYEDWRRGRVPDLEKVLQCNLSKLNFIMKTVRASARERGLKESWTAYKKWGKGRKIDLRFSKSGKPTIERTYATHFVKTAAPEEAQPKETTHG